MQANQCKGNCTLQNDTSYYYYYYYTIFIKRLSNKTITLSAVQNTYNVNPINKSESSNKSQE